MKKICTILLIIITLCPFPLFQAQANFRPELILTDNEMNDYQSMDQNDIQEFLERKQSPLATYRTKDNNNEDALASKIIFEASQAYHINPKVLLVLLQKEQSLIQGSPTQRSYDWATGYAVCDSCATDDPAIQQYKGFGNQVHWAAKRIQYYADYPHEYTFQKGNMYSIDNEDVMIINQATASLYNYTPHIHGNYNFWKIWQEWFKQKYPHGSLVKSEIDPTVYRIEYGRKRPFKSMSVLRSKYDPSKIITINPSELDAYEDARELKFQNYALLQDPENNLYLIVDDTIRQFESEAVFAKIEFTKIEVIHATTEDIQSYKMGDIITSLDAYPTGALLQDQDTGAVYFIYNQKRKPIISREILNSRFSHISLLQKPIKEIEQFELDAPLTFADGELISAVDSPAVYVIEHGKRRPITSATLFEQLGYKWENIITTTKQAVELHPPGEIIDTLARNSYNP